MIVLLVTHISSVHANTGQEQKNKIEPGIYVFVSFSMNDESLRSYYMEAEHYGAKLVMRGLAGEKNSRNRFATTQARLEKARINIDINPTLFEELNIKQVPFIVIIGKNGSAKKIGGHISLKKAIELMEESGGQK